MTRLRRNPAIEVDGDEPMRLDAWRCRELWRDVVRQAFEDALWTDPMPGAPITKSSTDDMRRRQMAAGVRARRWFRDNDQNYRLVCALADLDADVLREALLRRLPALDLKVVET